MPLKLKELRNRADETARTMQVYTHVRHAQKLILVQEKEKYSECVSSTVTNIFACFSYFFM
jgi:hypothetical protein